MDDLPSAEKYQRQAIEIFRATVSRNYPDHAVALANLGYILTLRGEYAEAEQLLTEALQIERTRIRRAQRAAGPNRIALGTSLTSGAAIRRAPSKPRRMPSRIASSGLGTNHYMTGYYLDGSLTFPQGQQPRRRRETAHGKAWRCTPSHCPRSIYIVASARQTLGEVLLRRGSLAAAESELRAALDINTALAGADGWRTARSAASLGWTLIRRDRSRWKVSHAGGGTRPTACDRGRAAPSNAGSQRTDDRILSCPPPRRRSGAGSPRPRQALSLRN